ncbi:MAG TPA: right-handed parallel beta-helix repeat-containing protein [Sediminibacterium sp.]|nr:right-handed parallel beta-helix repeat-containing protein [Sediminibacterium sp.]
MKSLLLFRSPHIRRLVFLNFLLAAMCSTNIDAAGNPAPVTYYIHPVYGNDTNSGQSRQSPLQSLAAIDQIKLHPGDTIVLASGQTFYGSLHIIQQSGDAMNPITILSAPVNAHDPNEPALINFQGRLYGILLEDASYIVVSGIHLTANGGGTETASGNEPMRCGVMVRNLHLPVMQHIFLNELEIKDIFFENPGYIRPAGEVKSANGTQKYGWGIRVLSPAQQHYLQDLTISNCRISNVSHTGIKLTGSDQNIREVKILHNRLMHTGGPGIQMSNVQSAYTAFNHIDHSGSTADSRNWGRGSGLWTWGCSDILIEKNTFQFANGPGDSDGAHIDFNCNNVILQYNLSAYNAGGFCEILGNTYNCIYRFNISINDGYRIKGKNGAFQEGKTLWLSGYRGDHQQRKGPVNTYIYNNTIYADSSIFPKIAFDNTSHGIFIANNIFYTVHPFTLVLGDQYKAELPGKKIMENMQVTHNLFLHPDSWPQDMHVEALGSFYTDPRFNRPGGMRPEDYIPNDTLILHAQGVFPDSDLAPAETNYHPAPLQTDLLNNPLGGTLPIGAIKSRQLSK